MTSEQQINEQLAKDMQDFYDKVYDGFIPNNFVQMFKKAIMHLAPAQHQYSMEKVRQILGRHPGEHTVLETSMMINAIYSTPFYLLYDSIEEAIRVTVEFDKVRKEYNKKVQEVERKMQAKRARLLKIAGIGGNSVPMKIIAEA